MPASVAIFLLVALPIAQASYAPTVGEPASPKPNRRIVAPEYETSHSPAAEPPARNIQPDDSRLADVCFIDPQHGWAVGDHGVIQHTDDGGQHWTPQVSGLRCTLNSVYFIDARYGWAAGGMAYPYLHDSSGVVLSTRDGGLSWQREPVLLPALREIRFWTHGKAGPSAALRPCFPAGLSRPAMPAEVGNRPFSGGLSRLLTADFFDGRNAILGGSLGLTATIGEGDSPAIRWARSCPASTACGRSARLRLAGRRRRLDCPDRQSWHRLAAAPGPAAAGNGPVRLRAGRPRTEMLDCRQSRQPRLFHARRREHLVRVSHRNTLPLRAITFVDDLHGWAVGQLGLILATDDGGRTWQRQGPAANGLRDGGGRRGSRLAAGVAGTVVQGPGPLGGRRGIGPHPCRVRFAR